MLIGALYPLEVKMKKILILIFGILLLGSVIAGTVILTRPTIQISEPISNEKEITWKCGEEVRTTTITEDEIDHDDLQRMVQISGCLEATDFQYNGDYWQENKYGDKSFNSTWLEEKENEKDGLVLVDGKWIEEGEYEIVGFDETTIKEEVCEASLLKLNALGTSCEVDSTKDSGEITR